MRVAWFTTRFARGEPRSRDYMSQWEYVGEGQWRMRRRAWDAWSQTYRYDFDARLAELVDAPVSKAGVFGRPGSSPGAGT
jgi:hypothetical protein